MCSFFVKCYIVHMTFLFVFFFFFSSRRRHTRCLSDWSSDVCSSDLSDPQKKQIYDTYGHAGLSGAGAGQGFDQTIFQDFHDIFGEFFGFEDLFGGGGSRRSRGRAQRGADLRYDMTLAFEEASAGVATKIKLPRQEFCEACNGPGAKKGTGVLACSACGGR